jgi:ABC-type uncharacterized transport system substrate-binding protein
MRLMRAACWAAGATAFLAGSEGAGAHPHVFVDANLEFVRNPDGAIVELRNSWRFDELFSSTVLLDYDADGDNKLDKKELDAVSKTVSSSISEYSYYTEMRYNGQPVKFVPPPRIDVDYQDGQILMSFSLKPEHPIETRSGKFKVSIADSTFYVAIEFASEAAIQFKGGAGACSAAIDAPDFDKLISQSQQTLTEAFFNNPKGVSLGDAWLTWITPKCK